jgi:hypothetical protein
MADKPMEADAGAVKFMIIKYFESRIGKVMEPNDIEFLEKSLPEYAARVCNEHMKAKGLLKD